MNRPLILITGATGKTGAAIAACLRSSGARLRLASRSGSGSVQFDWGDPRTFDAALVDAERVYILAPVGHSSPIDLVGPFIDKALAMGTRRFVLLSSTQLQEGGPAMGQIHAYLRKVAPEWGVLRPSWFMQNFISEPHLSSINGESAIYSATGDGRVPFVSVDDIAAIGARILLQTDAPEHDLPITGPELLSYDDVASQIGRAAGRTVRHIRLTVDELAERHRRFGLPADYAQTLAGLDAIIAEGREERLSGVVEAITGSLGISFASFVEAHAAVWR